MNVLAESKQTVLYMSLTSPVSRDSRRHGCPPITNLSSSGQISEQTTCTVWPECSTVSGEWLTYETWWWWVFGTVKSEEKGHVMPFHNNLRERVCCQSSGWEWTECHLPRANLMPVTVKVCWPSTGLLLLTRLDKRGIPVMQNLLNSANLKK